MRIKHFAGVISAFLIALVLGLVATSAAAQSVGWQARWAALALAAFTLLASVIFHNYWALPADQQMMQQLMFMKNLSIVGGLLAVFVFGAGTLSLDGRRLK